MTASAHADLVARAVRWLRGHHRCAVVFAEMTSAVSETPDAIGWYRSASHVVECKVSRSDFHRDRDKAHHRAGRAMGLFRWYLTPEGLLRADDLAPGVGLAEVRGARVKVIVEAAPREDRDAAHELQLLVSGVQRAHEGVRFDRDRARWEPYASSSVRIAAEQDTAIAAAAALGRWGL